VSTIAIREHVTLRKAMGLPRFTASHQRRADPESKRRAPDALPVDGHVEAWTLAEGEPLCLAIVANLALDQLSAERRGYAASARSASFLLHFQGGSSSSRYAGWAAMRARKRWKKED
jgi:hypothetical protein